MIKYVLIRLNWILFCLQSYISKYLQLRNFFSPNSYMYKDGASGGGGEAELSKIFLKLICISFNLKSNYMLFSTSESPRVVNIKVRWNAVIWKMIRNFLFDMRSWIYLAQRQSACAHVFLPALLFSLEAASILKAGKKPNKLITVLWFENQKTNVMEYLLDQLSLRTVNVKTWIPRFKGSVHVSYFIWRFLWHRKPYDFKSFQLRSDILN